MIPLTNFNAIVGDIYEIVPQLIEKIKKGEAVVA